MLLRVEPCVYSPPSHLGDSVAGSASAKIDCAKRCERAERGLIDADLGGGVIKQRLARKGQGRSGGYRALIVYRERERAVFLYGFAKNERDNVDADELARLRRAAADILMWSDSKLRNWRRPGN